MARKAHRYKGVVHSLDLAEYEVKVCNGGHTVEVYPSPYGVRLSARKASSGDSEFPYTTYEVVVTDATYRVRHLNIDVSQSLFDLGSVVNFLWDYLVIVLEQMKEKLRNNE